MIGLDTNVLIRYIVQDYPIQSRRATEIMEKLLSRADPGFVSVIAMVETVWVLERSYGLTPREIQVAVEGILQSESIEVQDEQAVFAAMALFSEGWGSFSDGLIAGLGKRAGCRVTLTFDRRAVRLPGFVPA
jgi:predicted nucleic-acid-binding protein